jgi:uncharacterized protein YukE
MSSPLSLTPAQAEAMISQIEGAARDAAAKMKRVQGTQESMLGGSWSGHSATTYGNVSSNQVDDYDAIIQQLNTTVETGSVQIRAVANADNG